MNMVNLDEFERLLLTNWTAFINPQRLLATILSQVRDSELPTLKKNPPSNKTSVQITMSQFRAAPDRLFDIWVDFVIPKSQGTAIGTCELRFDPTNGSLEITQTIGHVYEPVIQAPHPKIQAVLGSDQPDKS